MKYISILLMLLALIQPQQAEAAAAFGHSSAGNSSNTTSVSFAHNATGDSYLVAIFQTRATTGGCGATELTGFSATYNSVPLSFSEGTANTSITIVPASDCLHGKVMYLANPSTGSNTFSVSWTGNGYVAVTVMSFSGAGSLGTIVRDTSSGTTHSATASITSNDIAMGGLAFTELVANVSSAESNYIETADAGGFSLSAAATQSFTTGSETLSFTTPNTVGITWAIPVLATAVAGTSLEVPFYLFD